MSLTFRESVQGLDRILQGDIPPGSVVLVTGAEGTLKSGLVFNMASNLLIGGGGDGLYATLEQTKESHLSNMNSLGISCPKSLHIFDYTDMRHQWRNSEPDMFQVTQDVIDFYIDRYGPLRVIALDSLSVLYALCGQVNMRREMYYFFSTLRDKGLTSFLILETNTGGCGLIDSRERPEHFLADGVIELGVLEGSEGSKRYIQIKKMRSARHRMEKHQIVVGRDGLSILGPIY